MAKTLRSKGDTVLYANTGSAISSGGVVAMGAMAGIALVDIAATSGTGAVAITGVWAVPKATGEAWTVGARVGWDATASAFDLTFTGAAGDVLTCAVVTEAAASGDTTGYVRLCPGTGTAGS